jgi:polysaccharide biosynthesis protein PslG
MFAKFARIATTALAAAGLLAVATPASANANRATTPDVGVQFHGTWTRYTDAQRIDILDTLHAAGVTTVRIDVSWAMLQPVNGTSYDAWGTAFVDRVIALCNARGISPLITLWLTPGWANNDAGLYVLPTNMADYARVAQWAAARYTDKVAGWEVWNEQNSPAFLVGADPVAYTNLLKAAYPALHAGYADTTVVFGGLEYNDDAWISRAYAAGAQGSFDVMATHPYMGMANLPPDTPDDSTKWTLMHAAAVHDLMVANGDGDKSLWFTEFGWSTHANRAGTPNWELGVPEAVQAQYFTDTIALIRTAMPWVGKVYWYTGYGSAADDIEQKMNYDVLRRDQSPKPIMTAISAATQ